MMVKVMVYAYAYAYATGTFSSRKIARKLHENIAFRVLAASNFAAHRTIRDFRALHLGEFTELFVRIVRLAREMGLAKLGAIAVDGTKIKANASRHKAMSYGRMQSSALELKAQIEALVQKATSSDVQQLPMVLNAVKASAGASPAQVLADAGYRSEAVMADLAAIQTDTELVTALGREGKTLAKPGEG